MLIDWTSSIGYSDNAAHGNMDFLPWFLQEMKKAETTAGQRLLDYLVRSLEPRENREPLMTLAVIGYPLLLRCRYQRGRRSSFGDPHAHDALSVG